jgi:hypothetical protein
MNYFPVAPSAENNFLSQHIDLIAKSFENLLGYPLLVATDARPLAEHLFYAPCVLLSHNTDAEPLFNYANLQGLRLFELNWQALIALPSRASAEAINQAAREKLMTQVTEQGFIKNYAGIRISKTGKRFEIRHAIIWNLIDSTGLYQGQAAYFSEWKFL